MALAVMLGACTSFLENEDANKLQENEEQIQRYLKGNNLSATQDSTGLYYIINQANPSGQKAKVGDEASIYYRMYTLNGALVDSTETSKQKPLVIPVGTSLLLPGMEKALSLIRTGEKATFLLPYYLAWGNTAYEDIPAYSVIRIEMQLAGLRSEAKQIEDYVVKKEYTVSDKVAANLHIIRLNTVSGDSIGRGKSVKVNYSGKLLTGTEFDKGTLEFITGSGSMIPGFDQGIRKLRVGEKAVMIFSSSLGYGRTGRVNQQTGQYVIPPFAPMAFEVEIVSAK
ncbi:FKBP-type peptidyl-prolyl cis-trans isomerase [Telluribacter sp.]|jgi:FKBP-type peptidyl-prolyl cis-trans isomerase|uniref:FKBP-type peptidyl-prolyl cis-trans isomerase n=1 Tax=Telluribacter sp. TaxID=1978767 RepID=UPI002E108F71|nr:FKBP-type peptidyl-prolyl cis-trans isomerase [Telluribacter sp.]